MTRKKTTGPIPPTVTEPQPVENKAELGPVPPLDPIPDELDPAKREASHGAREWPQWWVYAAGAVAVALGIFLIWYVMRK